MAAQDKSGVHAALGGRTLLDLVRESDILPEDLKEVCEARGIAYLLFMEDCIEPSPESREQLLEAVRQRDN